MKATRIKVEHLINPIGVDFKKPTIHWNCEGGNKQSAYRIIVMANVKPLFDTGKVISSSMHYTFEKEIPSCTRVDYSIILWDENDKDGEETSAFFETGIDNFNAKWITGNYKVDKKKRYPVDCFRKKFYENNITKARLYITACGLYSCSINDKRCGDFCLTPGITDYNKRIYYQTYDVTHLLKNGENKIEVQLADGWYQGSTGAWGLKNQYGYETKLLIELRTTLNDGTVKTIISDDTWDYSNDGPIRFADNKDGEIVDANMTTSFNDLAKLTYHNVEPSCSNNVPVLEHETFKGSIIKTPNK